MAQSHVGDRARWHRLGSETSHPPDGRGTWWALSCWTPCVLVVKTTCRGRALVLTSCVTLGK